VPDEVVMGYAIDGKRVVCLGDYCNGVHLRLARFAHLDLRDASGPGTCGANAGLFRAESCGGKSGPGDTGHSGEEQVRSPAASPGMG